MFEDKGLKHHVDRYYGMYRGYVVDNKDPANEGRLKIAIPSVYGVEGGEPLVTDWCYPMLPTAGHGYGLQCIPGTENPDGSDVIVWVQFEMGDKNKPVWTGGAVSKDGLQAEALENQERKQQGKTTKALFSFSSPNGHRVLLNDETDMIIITTADGDSITLGNGIRIETSTEDKTSIAIVAGPNEITLDGDGKLIEVKSGENTKVVINGDKNEISLKTQKKVTIDAGGGDPEDEGKTKIVFNSVEKTIDMETEEKITINANGEDAKTKMVLDSKEKEINIETEKKIVINADSTSGKTKMTLDNEKQEIMAEAEKKITLKAGSSILIVDGVAGNITANGSVIG